MSIDVAALTGRDLDTAVAEWVMGYRVETVGKDAKGEHGGSEVLVPPTLLDDWWTTLPLIGAVPRGWYARRWSTEVEESIDLLEARFPWPRYYTCLCRTETGNWRCDIELHRADGPVISASAPTIPLAICRAAVLVGRKERGL